MKLKPILLTLVALILLLIVGGVWQAFKGNPIGTSNAKKETEQLLNERYHDATWSIVQTTYNFKDATYVVRVQNDNGETFHVSWGGLFGKTLVEDEIFETTIDRPLSERLSEEAENKLLRLFRSTRPEIQVVHVDFIVVQGQYDDGITWSPTLQPARPFHFEIEVDGMKYESTDMVQELAQHIRTVANKKQLDYSTGSIRIVHPKTNDNMYLTEFAKDEREQIFVRQFVGQVKQ